MSRKERNFRQDETSPERDDKARPAGARHSESAAPEVSSSDSSQSVFTPAEVAGLLQELVKLRDEAKKVTELEKLVTQMREVNENLIMAKLEMSHLAHHDFLTNLPNRIQLNDRLAHAITLAYRNRKKLAILFLDLDHFKSINDTLGHAVGDKLLQAVGQRLKGCVRTSDTVSRQGGDEFVILVSEIEHIEDASRIAEKIINALTLPYQVDEHTLYITTSIGISVYPADGVEAEMLIKHADAAMYHAKKSGRNQYQFFIEEMNRLAIERQTMEGSLRAALERREFRLHYQPKVNLNSGNITGVEALIRWHHPQRGLVYPEHFISIAEESGLIVPIGEWVLKEACEQAMTWLHDGQVFNRVAVNLSAIEFHHGNFMDKIRAVLNETGLPPRHLELELTESVLMNNADSTISLLKELKTIGVHLAVDDFGTGYSSLSYLKRFPVDVLKIDKSFVKDIAIDPDVAVIVDAVINIGNCLKQRVIAEGIETEQQLMFLQHHHCEEGQGYYFSEPLAVEEFTSLLRTGLP
ncbi:MAG: EAL domain-containing protein [Pseudomonadota bacterium]